MPAKSIAVVHPETRENKSHKGTTWLDWVEVEKGIVLAREVCIYGFYVDGYHAETRTVYAFNGCHWRSSAASYISFWLKIKQEASGWPGWVKSDEDKQKYIDDYRERMGIELEADKIEFNDRRRKIA